MAQDLESDLRGCEFLRDCLIPVESSWASYLPMSFSFPISKMGSNQMPCSLGDWGMKCGNPSREPGNGVTFVLGVDPASSCEGSDQSSVSSFPLRQVCLFFFREWRAQSPHWIRARGGSAVWGRAGREEEPSCKAGVRRCLCGRVWITVLSGPCGLLV